MSRKRCVSLLIGSLLGFPATPVHAQQADAPYTPLVQTEMGEKLHAWLTRAEAFGLHGAVLIEQDGRVILRRGYGLADREEERPITVRTRFDIGSLSKQFTAAAVAYLVEGGKLTWNQTLSEVLPDVPADKAEITLHQLLTHTAGLPYQPPRGRLLDATLVSEPGEGFVYSNVGYGLLGQIVEEAGEQTLEETCAELFRRAKVSGITASGRDAGWDDEAHGYVNDFDFGPPSRLRIDDSLKGAGGYACTVGELYQWISSLESGVALGTPTVERMFTNHTGGRNGYGYGWFVLQTMRGTPLVQHMGDHNGFNSVLRRYRNEQRTIVFLSNTFTQGRSLHEAVVNRLALMLAGRPVPNPPSVLPWSPLEAAPLAGEYITDRGRRYSVSVREDSLWISALNQDSLNVLFGVAADPGTPSLLQDCERRSRALLQALRENDQSGISDQANPTWVAALRDLSEAYRRAEESCGQVLDVEILGTAILDSLIQNAQTLVELRGTEGQERMDFTWTRRGAVGCDTGAQFPGIRLLRTGERRYGAFNLFTAKAVEARFTSEDSGPILTLDSGAVRDRALAE